VSTVAVGCILNGLFQVDASRRRELVASVEDAGLDHLGVGDHVSFFGGHGFDGLVNAAGLLAASDRLAVNTAVYLLPLRHPVTVARQLADLSVLGPGRFTFGVGIGGEDPHEVESCGVDPRRRGSRTDEALAIVRALMTGEPVDHQGANFSLAGAQILPPVAAPIPILVGGRSEAALRRAGRFGDGWFGIWVSAQRYAAACATVDDAGRDHGRTDVAWRHALNVWIGVGDDPGEARAHLAPAMERFYGIPYERFERWSPAGTPDDVATFLVPYVHAGARLINLIPAGRDLEHEIAASSAIRRRIIEGTT
jgi:alkanesulfonate monooxygenase SsuD/methylene tetrahydromethanopterin reductase-like flavin-dependent oxidoreductase (luciferase family)